MPFLPLTLALSPKGRGEITLENMIFYEEEDKNEDLGNSGKSPGGR
jgi:hypothetical protein